MDDFSNLAIICLIAIAAMVFGLVSGSDKTKDSILKDCETSGQFMRNHQVYYCSKAAPEDD